MGRESTLSKGGGFLSVDKVNLEKLQEHVRNSS